MDTARQNVEKPRQDRGERVLTKSKVREFTELEKDSLIWLVGRTHDSAFITSLKGQVMRFLHELNCRGDSKASLEAPLSPKQFNALFDNYENWLRSEHYRILKFSKPYASPVRYLPMIQPSAN